MFINISGTWRKVSDGFININGTWRKINDAFVNISGTWRRFWSVSSLAPQFSVTITQTTNATTKLVTLTGTNYYWSPGPPSLTYNFQWWNGTSWSNISTGTAINPSFGGSTSYTQILQSTGAAVYVQPNQLNRFRFRVNATYGSQSTSSNSSETTVQGPTSVTLTAGETGASSASLSWTASTGANRYMVYYSTNNSTFTEYGGTGSLSITVSGLNENTLYYFKIIPITGTTDNSGYYGSYSNTVTATTKITPGILSRVESYNFDGNIQQGFFTTGTNTTKVNYYFSCISIPSLSVPTYTQNTVSGRPYKIQQNLLSYFTIKTWNPDTYNASTTYSLNNTVWYAGNQYQAKANTFFGASTAPSVSGSNTYWTRGSIVGITPYEPITWSSSTSYTQGQVVYYGTGNTNASVYSYTANDPGFSGRVPTNTTYWTRIQTVSYNIGDYVLYNGGYYFCKSATNGTYPTNITYWIADYASFQIYATPYNVDVAGLTSAGREVVITANQAPQDPLRITSGPTFSNITQTAFRTNFLPSVYTNQVDFYIQKKSNSTYVSGYNPRVINVSGSTSTNHDTVTILDSDTEYLVNIMARYVYDSTYSVSHNGSSSSNPVTTLTPLPDPPTNLNVSDVGTNRPYGNAAYSLYWTQPSFTGGTLSGYKVQYQVPSSSSSWLNYSSNTVDISTTPSSASPLALTGFASGLATNFRVYSVNASGQSATAVATSTAITGTTVPQAPTIGTATTVNGSVTVTYTGGQTGGSSVTEYKATSTPGSITGTASSGSISVTGLTHNTSYTFKVTATNANGTSLASSASNTAYGVNIGAPSVTSSSVSGKNITLNFTKGTNSTSTRTFINGSLDSSTTGSSYTFVLPANSTTYSLGLVGRGTVNSVTYDSSATTGSYTTGAASTAPSGGSASISGTATSGQLLTLTKTDATGSPGPSASWVWQRNDGGFGGGTYATRQTGGNTYTLTTFDVTYSIRAVVTWSNGISPAKVITTNVIGPIVAPPPPPATPTGVAFSGSGVVSWTASTGSPTSYEIEFFTATSNAGADAAGPYTVTGISASPYQLGSTGSTQYAYPNNYARVRVRARNSGGASAYSAWRPSATSYT